MISVALGACSSSGPSTGPVPPELIERFQAELDRSTGAVILPYDRFVPTWLEADLINVGGSAALALCAKDGGVTFVPPAPLDDPVYSSEHYLGPWTTDQAERFGFLRPASERDLIANGVIEGDLPEAPVPNEGLSDADWLVVDECAETSAVTEFNEALNVDGPWLDEIQAVADSLLDHPRAKELVSRLGECYREHGLTPLRDYPVLPEGVGERGISEHSIALALTVVGCKDQVEFTEGMAALEAELQAPILAKYERELAAQRERIDAALDEARQLTARLSASS